MILIHPLLLKRKFNESVQLITRNKGQAAIAYELFVPTRMRGIMKGYTQLIQKQRYQIDVLMKAEKNTN